MQARRCQGCAAPLPESAAGASLRCPFCGLLHDAANAGETVPPIAIDLSIHRTRMPRWVLALIVVILLVAVVPTVIGLLVAWRAASAVLPPSTLSSTSTSPKAARTTADLADVPAGYHALDVAPPAGGFGAVDAVAALPWALAIAQAWEADARLIRIDLERLRPDGTLNVQDDGEAALTYRFVSPGRTGALRQQARLQAGAEAVVGMWVRVKGGKVQVYADGTRASMMRDEPPPPHPDSMSLPGMFARDAVRALAAELPFLNGYLIHLEREGWVWYFSSLAGESRPRVRARDAAVWPYGRGARQTRRPS